MKKIEVIKSYYQSNMQAESPDYKILGWESQEAQHLRFGVITSNIQLEGKRVLDVGCGLGNFLQYINQKGISVKYTGVDILETMVERAKSKNLKGTFLCTNIFKNNPFKKNSFDLVYASGIFNLNIGNNKQFLPHAIDLFYQLSCNVVAFNLLHKGSPHKDDRYFYFFPDEVINLIVDLNYKFKKVETIEKYLDNDFTVICRKV